MHFRCTACIVKSTNSPPHDAERPAKSHAVVRIVEPPRSATRMRKWDEDALPVDATASHGFAEWNASPEALDRERSDEQHDTRSYQRELGVEPRGAERDLRRRRSPIPRSARRLSGKALRDRRAIRQMRLVYAGLCEPASQLRPRASREWKSSRELHRSRRLADDHHAIARLACDDRERGGQAACSDALRARANARVKTCERAFSRDHDVTGVGTRGLGVAEYCANTLWSRTGCSAAW